MKGDHLSDNMDSTYKKAVLEFLKENFCWDNTPPVGELQLENKGETVVCALVTTDEWNTTLPKFFQ